MINRAQKRLAMEISIELHCKIKQVCAEKNITITQWVHEAILEKLKYEMDLGY